MSSFSTTDERVNSITIAVNAIIQRGLALIYHYGFIFPVLPNHPKALGYILRFPSILKPCFTSLYQRTSTGILIKNNVVQYNLPKHAVFINCTLKEIIVASCTA